MFAARSDEIQIVTFLLAQQEYAVDVMAVREVISMPAITKTANSPHYVEGVIDLRGTIVPIISLRRRLNMPDMADTAMSCIAVMDFANELTGFVIDEVSDVMRISRSDVSPPLDVTSEPWVEGILNLEQRLIVLMNLRPLMEQ